MPFLQNIATGAVIGPIEDDSSEYLFLQALRDDNSRPTYEQISGPQAGASATEGGYTHQAIIAASTILATTVEDITEVTQAGNVVKVEYLPVAAVTGAANPASRKLKLVNGGGNGTGTTVVAELDLGLATNLVANDSNVLVNGVAANLVVAVGDNLKWSSAPDGGTGLVDPGGLVVITLE